MHLLWSPSNACSWETAYLVETFNSRTLFMIWITRLKNLNCRGSSMACLSKNGFKKRKRSAWIKYDASGDLPQQQPFSLNLESDESFVFLYLKPWLWTKSNLANLTIWLFCLRKFSTDRFNCCAVLFRNRLLEPTHKIKICTTQGTITCRKKKLLWLTLQSNQNIKHICYAWCCATCFGNPWGQHCPAASRHLGDLPTDTWLQTVCQPQRSKRAQRQCKLTGHDVQQKSTFVSFCIPDYPRCKYWY